MQSRGESRIGYWIKNFKCPLWHALRRKHETFKTIIFMKTFKTIIFWFLSLTWGLPMTLMGAVVALALLITGHKPKRFHHSIYFEVGENWGGFEAGGFFFTDKTPSLHTKQHESGHGLQNIVLGPLMPFVVSIPSAIRYWYRRIKQKRNPSVILPPYDSIWFEGQATRLGEKYFNEKQD